MKAVELEKSFNHKEFEDRIYEMWKERGYFSPGDPSKVSAKGNPFVIVIPPPNVTGVLHMGHGLNNSLQDVLVRYHRMLGEPTLWVPGTDHAGIATQNVVDRKLRERGIDKYDLGREKFVDETWKVKEEHHKVITRQLERIGASCDWSRERFTLDDGLSRAVNEVFVTLYERDLIYRGYYLVNWCPSCGTALSDDEVVHWEEAGKLYRYTYPLEDGSGNIEIATTRPESMLGDMAVAVHPEDSRYSSVIGKRVTLPLVGRSLPVVADEYVDMEFGSGAVKITPGHDQNDYDIALRHELELLNILNPDGTLNENVPERYRDLSVKDARAKVVEDLKEHGYYLGDEDNPHQIGHCYRCDSVIEPYLSEQWFVRMRPLADKALGAWKRGEVRFYPKRWENTYTAWLENIRDWCISRQLWWGHRIPVWYDQDNGEMIVSREDPTEKPENAGRNLVQDEDVLDTWFSSWLWPFSTLGWPEQTEDLEVFFPTSTLVTAYDIIFFWVARMIMAAMEFMGQAPFRDIYITGLIRDKQGRKMSKSLGNGIDPLDVVNEFGADAHKFTLAFLATSGQDILLEKDDFHFGSKFANKIWNASRYILMNLEGRNLVPIDELHLTDVDRWIYHRLNVAAVEVQRSMEAYRFSNATQAVYEYFWSDFCDWYIEATKLSLYSDDEAEKDRGVSLLIYVLEESLRLLHPFMSFITEEIFTRLPDFSGKAESAIIAPYPLPRDERSVPEINSRFGSLQELVRLIRTLRSEFTIPPAKRISFEVKFEADFDAGEFLRDHVELIRMLTGAEEIGFVEAGPSREGSVALVGVGFEVYVYVRDVIDVATQVARLEKNRQKAAKQLDGTRRKLANPGFLENAGEDIVNKEREKEQELSRQVEKLDMYLADLKN